MLLATTAVFAQSHINGKVTDAGGNPIADVAVFTADAHTTLTDADGYFDLETPSGRQQVTFLKDGFALTEAALDAPSSGNVIHMDKVTALPEVVVRNYRQKLFAIRRLRDVEGTAIYAGRKSEVVSVGQLTANKSLNNARQIFSQVTGLTISEGADGGLQLNIGGRGLDANRTSNFNTRQNGYDISADVLGYPESYYAPPAESIDEIQIVRGAASLQYGTQFGGLVNFKLHGPSDKKIELTERNTIGSYGLYANYSALSGTVGKFSYYTFFNYKDGNGARPDSHYTSRNFFANLNYRFSDRTTLRLDYTWYDYLARQPGGLTDYMFNTDPNQSNRARNWFAVDWNLFALKLEHRFSGQANFSLQLFGLDASRKTVGYRTNRVSQADPGGVRDLIDGGFANWGAEARYVKSYHIKGKKSTLLLGAKYYQSHNTSVQGAGSDGSGPDFHPASSAFPSYPNQSDYTFPNLNLAAFGENIFRLSPKVSVTPGFRIEKIRTRAEGFYRKINLDQAGNVILDDTIPERNVKDRNIVLVGAGLSYKPKNTLEFYANLSQNYRSVTFNDIRTASPSQVIAPDITDEKGYTSDVGFRGQWREMLAFDANFFGLYYGHKIGEYETQNPDGSAALVRLRDNIGNAVTYGFESFIDWKIDKTLFKGRENFSWDVFSNLALTGSRYLDSDAPGVKGNAVEFVPLINLKTGMGAGYKNLLASVQFTYVSQQFTDANNSRSDANDNTYGIFGQVPAYYVADFSASYKWEHWKLEAGVNNFTDNVYFTRRATGYPGPGIIPSERRSFYATLEFMF